MSSFRSKAGLFLFPLAVLFNNFSMTMLLIIMGISGHFEIAGSIGLVQGSVLATFYVFSANARNLILAEASKIIGDQFLQLRLVLLLPLACIAYYLSTNLGGIAPSMVLVLILRRVSEWIGEIYICQQERLDHRSAALRTILAEIFLLFLCIILSLRFGADFASSAIPWALAPLISVSLSRQFLNNFKLFNIYSILPHFGSTAIIGISVYVFRVSVIALIGIDVAGELFTAFAIGGIIPVMFGQILAPTFLRRFGNSAMQSRLMLALLIAMFASGGGIAMLANGSVGANLNHVPWLAIGFSISGGAIMFYATLLRAKVISNNRDEESVVGPDILSNILLVLSIPFVYFAFGKQAMSALYLLSSCLNLIYIFGVTNKSYDTYRISLFVFGALLLVPVYFQLQGGVFDDPSMVFNTGDQLFNLPIPLSVFAVFGGIAILGRYAVAKRSLICVFFTMIMYMVSIFSGTNDPTQLGGKLVLAAQFIYPIFGMILGEMFGIEKKGLIFERVALWVFSLILSAQLVATWISGHMQLRPLVFFFSIYQHIEYFPSIVAALATMVIFALWRKSESNRVAIGVMVPIVLLHLVASGSISAIFAGVTGISACCIYYWHTKQSRWRLLIVTAIGILVAAIYTMQASTDNSVITPDFRLGSSVTAVSDRFCSDESLQVFLAGIVESPQEFVLGHATRPDRNLYPNAQNYWLDVVYSFGVLGVAPFLVLLGLLSRSIWKLWKQVLLDPVLLGTLLGTIYLVLVESMFSIGMRQVYPGFITFFILGLLSARLNEAKA